MRLSYASPNADNGTGWYRVVSPMGHIQRHYAGVHVSVVTEVNVGSALLSDVVVFHRPSTYKEIEAMRVFRRAGVPVIVDYDDNDLNVPSDFPTYFNFANPDVRNAMLFAMEEATAVTVTTEHLRQEIKKIYPHQHVYAIPNALDPVFHREMGVGKKDVILWRGGVSHQRDLFSFMEEFEHSAKSHKLPFQFFGYHPWFLEGSIPRERLESEPFQSSVPNFWARLHRIAPKYAVVPLLDTTFNRSKSNIAWLEHTWAGAVCLVPDWEEWDQPGVIHYHDKESFRDGLEKLVSLSEEERKAMHAESWEAIQKKYVLGATNRRRMQLYMAAMGCAQWPGEEDPINEAGPRIEKVAPSVAAFAEAPVSQL